jgi:hypothetical protein
MLWHVINGFVFVYSLPWQGLKAATKKQKYDKICEKKLSTPIEVLCKSHPVEFASYFHYCHSLTFDQRPDYGFLKRLFHDLFDREGIDLQSLVIGFPLFLVISFNVTGILISSMEAMLMPSWHVLLGI